MLLYSSVNLKRGVSVLSCTFNYLATGKLVLLVMGFVNEDSTHPWLLIRYILILYRYLLLSLFCIFCFVIKKFWDKSFRHVYCVCIVLFYYFSLFISSVILYIPWQCFWIAFIYFFVIYNASNNVIPFSLFWY